MIPWGARAKKNLCIQCMLLVLICGGFGYFGYYFVYELIFSTRIRTPQILYGPDTGFIISFSILIIMCPFSYFSQKYKWYEYPISFKYVKITTVIIVILILNLFILPYILRNITEDYFRSSGYFYCEDHPEYDKRGTGRSHFMRQVWVLDEVDCSKELYDS